MSEIPSENQIVHQQMYVIEVVMREFIIERFEASFGTSWWKQQIPQQIRDAAVDRFAREKMLPWLSVVPQHLMYFTDFPHLKQIAERNDNWNACFRPCFGANKAVLTTRLSHLEPIRNKIAHNRRATESDVVQVNAAYTLVADSLGGQRIRELLFRNTVADSIPERLKALMAELARTHEQVVAMKTPDEPSNWNEIGAQWWFTDDYLGSSLQPVEDFYASLEHYRTLPRSWGQGYKIQEWVQESAITETYELAVRILNDLIGKDGE